MLAESVGKRYGSTVAVRDFSLRVNAGEVVTVLGPNGAGKTTSLEICEGFRRPDTGRVRVLGVDPLRFTAAHRARVGIMLQSGGVWSMARPLETVRHIASLFPGAPDPGPLAEELGLDRCGRTPFRRLSGGEQQRVRLACALVGRPDVVFLDEPTAGVDPHMRRAVWRIIGRERDRGAAVVLTTHLLDEAEELSDRIVILHRGAVVAEGSPTELLAGGECDHILLAAGMSVDADDLLRALPPGSSVSRQRPGVYSIEAAISPEVLSVVSAWCAENGVPQHAISIKRRTLEDLFLTLTSEDA